MTNVKYQIFISSTYDDLKAVRSEVVRAVLEMGHIPVGMEMFSAADEQQWDIIARTIDQSDYYVVIIGHRYGSVTPDGISFTEKEYRYAESRNIPILGFILDPTAPWPVELVDSDAEAKSALDVFKELVRTRPVGFWRNADDLHSKCSIALMKAFTASPREGWIRGSSAASAELTTELTRLSVEAASLREQLRLATARSDAEDEARHRATLRSLRGIERRVPWKANTRSNEWNWTDLYTLLDVFMWLAPTMLTENELNTLCILLGVHIRGEDEGERILPTNWMQEVLGDLAIFDLVEPSTRKHSVHDKGEYWSLTESGVATYKAQRRLALESKGAEERRPNSPSSNTDFQND